MLTANRRIPFHIVKPGFHHSQERVSKTLPDVSKHDGIWTRMGLEKTTLAQHEIVKVAVVVFGWKLAGQIACLFKVHVNRQSCVGHVATQSLNDTTSRLTRRLPQFCGPAAQSWLAK